jgi:hypothetical protein
MAHHDEKSRNTRSASSPYQGQKYNPYQGRDLIKEDSTNEDSTQTPQKNSGNYNRTNQSNQMNNPGYYNPNYPPLPHPSYLIQEKKSNTNGFGASGFVLSFVGFILLWVPVLIKYLSVNDNAKTVVSALGFYAIIYVILFIVDVILWMLGGIFSIIGCFKEPRGLAIAGIVFTVIVMVAGPFILTFTSAWGIWGLLF